MHHKISFLLTLFLLLLGVALPASALTHQPASLAATTTLNLPLSMLSQYGGGVEHVKIVGNRAYVTIGPRVFVLDISDPALPNVLGSTPLLTSPVWDMAVAGNYLHVAIGDSGYQIYDITDPSTITLAGSEAGTFYVIAIDGTIAYLFTSSTLHVLNISNPATITNLATANNIIGSSAEDFEIFTSGANTYIAVGAGDPGLYIIDVTNPVSPTNIGNFDTPSFASEVKIAGNYAFIADSSSIQIANISTPSAPTFTGELTGLSNVTSLDVAQIGLDQIIFTTSDTGFKIYDANDYDAIAEIGSYSSGASNNFNRRLFFANSEVYLAASEQGLHVVDVNPPDTPTQLITLGPVDRMLDGAMLNDTTLIVANGSAGFKVLDVSNPSNPNFINSIASVGSALLVKTIGSNAVLFDTQQMRIFDMSDPASPVQIDSFNTSFIGTSMVTNGNTLVVGLQVGNFLVYDISDPSNITFLGQTALGSGTTTIVRMVGSRLYAITDSGGLYIYDLTNPSSPALLGSYLSSNFSDDFVLIGNYLVSNPNNTGLVIDVSDPTQPNFVTSQIGTDFAPSCGQIRNMEVRGSIMVVNCFARVALVDMSDPLSPQFISAHNLISIYTNGIVLNGNQVFALQGVNGLIALEYQLYQVMLPILQK